MSSVESAEREDHDERETGVNRAFDFRRLAWIRLAFGLRAVPDEGEILRFA
jgi:hypothetical protein